MPIMIVSRHLRRGLGTAGLVAGLMLLGAAPALAGERPTHSQSSDMCTTATPGMGTASANGAAVSFAWTEAGVSWTATAADAKHFRVAVVPVTGKPVSRWGLSGSWLGGAVDHVVVCYCPQQEETPPADEETPPADEETPPADEETPPADEETPPAEEEVPAADEETPPADEETPPADEETPPVEVAPSEQAPVGQRPEVEVLSARITAPAVEVAAASSTRVAAARAQTLPETGVETSVMALLGGSLLAGGVTLVARSRRMEEELEPTA